jgi:hypothetical protein
MLLRMSPPARRDGSSAHYLRKRIPADVIAKAQGMVLRVLVGEEYVTVRVGNTGAVRVSLRTADRRQAKERQAKALAYLDDVWRSLREAPRRLTQRQVIALAGEWYRHAKKTWEDDPGRATLWNMLHEAALKWDAATAQKEMVPYVAELLQQKALQIDDGSRTRLAAALHGAFKDATALLERRGRGDYGPDVTEQRFPEWEPSRATKQAEAITVSDVFAGWELESRAAGVTQKDDKGFRPPSSREPLPQPQDHP